MGNLSGIDKAIHEVDLKLNYVRNEIENLCTKRNTLSDVLDDLNLIKKQELLAKPAPIHDAIGVS